MIPKASKNCRLSKASTIDQKNTGCCENVDALNSLQFLDALNIRRVGNSPSNINLPIPLLSNFYLVYLSPTGIGNMVWS